MKYESDTHYAMITEQFRRKDGDRSYYNMLMGNGQFTIRLDFKSIINRTKKEAMNIVHGILKRHVGQLDTYNIIENGSGWTYERYVKNDEEDFDNYEIVEKGNHTDHEVFDVYVFYIKEDSDAFSKLK